MAESHGEQGNRNNATRDGIKSFMDTIGRRRRQIIFLFGLAIRDEQHKSLKLNIVMAKSVSVFRVLRHTSF